MYTPRLLDVLVVALSTLSAAQAVLVSHAPHNGHAVVKRQGTGISAGGDEDTATTPTSSTPVAATSTPKATTPSSTPVVTTPTSTPSPSPSPSSPSPTPSPSSPEPAETTSTPAPSSEEPSPSSSSTPTSTTSIAKETSTDASPSTTAAPVTSTSTMTVLITSTDAGGKVHTSTSVSTETSTSTPGLADAQKSGQNTGMSTQTRNTVIGVVVGVGGAAILAGIAFLFFRLHRKKTPEEGDGLMEYDTGYPATEKPSDVGSMSPGTSARSPFQSTLETYHAPTQVNTASNF